MTRAQWLAVIGQRLHLHRASTDVDIALWTRTLSMQVPYFMNLGEHRVVY